MNQRNFRGGSPGLGWPQLATYPQSPLSRAGVLLRRSVPVPGILATHRPGGRLWISLGAILLPDIQFGDDRIKT
jgi:hypothetical protein